MKTALAALVVVLLLAAPASAARRSLVERGVPRSFIAAALCVHDGWHHSSRAPYARTWNVPDWIKGGSGEAGWGYRGSFRGGLQWTYGTWSRAGGHGDPADASPAEEIFRAWIVVRRNGGRWSDWPQTARACGLPT